MFKQLSDNKAEMLTIELDVESVTVPAGISVAAAMLYLDAAATRQTPVSGSPRAAFCMMGVCFECLMEIDGSPNRRACQVVVTAGMRVRRQLGARDNGQAS